jgi:serine protease Do
MIDETTAKALGLPKAAGVLIQEVVQNGAAEKAGIKSGDVLLTVDGKEIMTANQLQEIVARRHPGDVVKLKLFRDGKEIEKSVTLMSNIDENVASESKPIEKGGNSEPSKVSASFDNLGMSIRNLSNEEKTNFKVDYGVMVSNVKNFGIAQTRGIYDNSVITDVIQKGSTVKIQNVNDFEKIIKSSKSGDAFMIKLVTIEVGPRLVAIEIP